MSGGEDDYMSNKILVKCANEGDGTSLLFTRAQKRKHEMYKKQRVSKPKSYTEQEKETRDKGLNTAIAADNKGFKLLKKMGYQTGTGLGKSDNGVTQPVTVKVKATSSGFGRDEYLQEMQCMKQELQHKVLADTEEEFRLSNAMRHNMYILQKDYKEAQKICEELDLQSGAEEPVINFFWSKETRDSLKKKKEIAPVDDEEHLEPEEEEGDISESRLHDMIVYLRRTHSYCVYCGDYVRETDSSASSCPGYFRHDHDK